MQTHRQVPHPAQALTPALIANTGKEEQLRDGFALSSLQCSAV